MVARVHLDLGKLLPDLSADQRFDLRSLQVIRQDPDSSPYPRHAQHALPGDRPFRFYDAGPSDDLPAWRHYASVEAQAGRPVFVMTEHLPFGQCAFTPTGEHVRGTLVWAHTQVGSNPSRYGIYFDLMPRAERTATPPAGWIGDGSNRVAPMTQTAGPPGNNQASVVDWNHDTLPDLLFGTSAGYVVVAENTGTRESPAFDRRQLVCDASGLPIDVGYDASPLMADWNDDGLPDLIIGTEKGCVVYFENRGSTKTPKFAFRGFVQTDGRMLLTPNWPIAELPAGKPGEVYAADYLANPHVCDWDGDGDIDLLAGGFVTGRVFWFENVGKLADGTPDLRDRGPLLVDGTPLDTGWGAAPVAVDLDADGDLDLVSGAKPVNAKGGDTSDPNANLFYFENAGSRTHPELKRRPFPANAANPTGTSLMALVCDWNGDSLSDLLLVTRSSMQVFAVPNVGSHTKPLFDMNRHAIPAPWSNAPLSHGTFVDWNRDGFPDIINQFFVSLNSRKGFPHGFDASISLLAGQKPIRHPNPHGDENSFVTLVRSRRRRRSRWHLRRRQRPHLVS